MYIRITISSVIS